MSEITVGINLKNRGVLKFYDGWNQAEVVRRPFETLLTSLENQTDKNFDVRVVDWQSTDINILSIVQKSNLNIFVSELHGDFNRSEGKNYLIDSCETPLLFLLDADMIAPPNLIDTARRVMASFRFWFPACRYERSVDGSMLSDYIPTAAGNVCGHIGAFRSLKFKTGAAYRKWGNEDVNFFDRVRANPAHTYLRDNCEGLIHQYHTDRERKQYDH